MVGQYGGHDVIPLVKLAYLHVVLFYSMLYKQRASKRDEFELQL